MMIHNTFYKMIEGFCSVLFCSVQGPMHLFMKVHKLYIDWQMKKHLSVSPAMAPFPLDGVRIICVAFFLERFQQFGRWGSRCYPHGQRGLGIIFTFDDIGKNISTSAFSINIKADWDQPLKCVELLMMFFSTLESYCCLKISAMDISKCPTFGMLGQMWAIMPSPMVVIWKLGLFFFFHK